ncbi:MAG: DUF6677 family protein [Thermoguttaceae bacterium]
MAEALDPESHEPINLKDPMIAGLLAWLVPGLGHWYQGRREKAVLYFVAIMGLFLFGLILGGGATYRDVDGREHHTGYGRGVYFSWNPEKRLHYLGQVGVGLAAMPALLQAALMNHNEKVLWGGFMAPPWPSDAMRSAAGRDNPNFDQPTRAELDRWLNRRFELAGVFGLIAGLLNVLAIYDACAGPVPPASKKDEEPREEKKDEAAA